MFGFFVNQDKTLLVLPEDNQDNKRMGSNNSTSHGIQEIKDHKEATTLKKPDLPTPTPSQAAATATPQPMNQVIQTLQVPQLPVAHHTPSIPLVGTRRKNMKKSEKFVYKSKEAKRYDMNGKNRNIIHMSGKKEKTKIALTSYNCKGFKQSSDYIVSDLIPASSILCLTETWLKHGELCLIEEMLKKHNATHSERFSVFSKSSMKDMEEYSKGRPYGGTAIMQYYLHYMAKRGM